MPRQYGEKHHILHHRALHEANKDSKILRNSLGMIALIDPDIHDELHRVCPGVPPLDIWTAQRTRAFMVPHPNPLQAIDNYLQAVERATQSPKSHPIERDLAALTMMAVELQKPYIKEVLINERMD